jgi:hypothetical protein
MQVLKKHVRQLTVARNQLARARNLLEKPNAWIQGDYATTKDGRMTWPEMPDAKCFCAHGALMRAQRQGDDDASGETLAYSYLNHVMAPSKADITKEFHVASKNDNAVKDQQQILMHFDLAILLVEDELKFAQSRVAQ